MQIKKLEGKERFDAYLISMYCFHGRTDDPEKEREKIEKETQQDWGAFTEDGILTARIINNKFKFLVDGTAVEAGGIGAVSTLPEYRNMGSVRQIFEKLLPQAYADGEVISGLYPFNQAFYRKQGYEVVAFQNRYEFAPEVLAPYRFNGKVTRWNMEDPVMEFSAIYNEFIKKFNCAMPRKDKDMLAHLKVEKLYQERKFSYILEEDGQKIAYIIFTDVRNDSGALLKVNECAWTGRQGFYAILGFLARFSADYVKIELSLPYGIDLLKLIQAPKAYDVKKTTQYGYMLRVINAKKLLEIIKKPEDCDFVIQVTDELIEQNNGIWRVTKENVEEEESGITPDICVSQRALIQMTIGSINFEEALLRQDVCVNAKEEMLKNVFVQKNIYINEYY